MTSSLNLFKLLIAALLLPYLWKIVLSRKDNLWFDFLLILFPLGCLHSWANFDSAWVWSSLARCYDRGKSSNKLFNSPLWVFFILLEGRCSGECCYGANIQRCYSFYRNSIVRTLSILDFPQSSNLASKGYFWLEFRFCAFNIRNCWLVIW